MRAACRVATEKALTKAIDADSITEDEQKHKPKEVAHDYEANLYRRYRDNLTQYKLRFRKELVALRNVDTEFAEELLKGEMTVEELGELKGSELISKKQRKENKMLLERELRRSIGEKLPDTLSEVPGQNTVTREKWGVSESAAKIDPMFDN